MARINIEETIFFDPRFDKLVITLKSRALAIGSLVVAWRLAQTYYKTNQVGVPIEVFKGIESYSEILGVGLGIIQDDFVYLKGSHKAFEWMEEMSIGGKNGAIITNRIKAAKKIQSLKSLDNPDRVSQGSTPSLSSSSSSSSSSSNSLVGKQKAKNAASQTVDSTKVDSPHKKLCSEIWLTYSKAFESRYGTPPIRNAKVNGQVKILASRLPAVEVCTVVEFYLKHDSQFYTRSMHPIGLALADAEKLRAEWASGNTIKDRTAKTFSEIKSDHNKKQIERILKGEL